MTENTILRSVKFDKDDKERRRGLVGGSIEKNLINNKPPTVLFPNEENLSRYAAVFPGYSIDHGNMLDIGPSVGNQLFMADYPQYPNSKTLAINPTLPVEEKFYSTDDDDNNSMMMSNESNYSSHDGSSSDKSDDDSSYV